MASMYVEGQAASDDLSRPIGAATFKARCLQIMDRVNETGAEVIITKHGRPVAKLVPVQPRTEQSGFLGSCRETLLIVDGDDLVPSTADEWSEWEAAQEALPDVAGPT